MKGIVYSAKLCTVEDLKHRVFGNSFTKANRIKESVLFSIHTDKKLLGIHVNVLYIRATIFEATS
jgi:hypothetical protein